MSQRERRGNSWRSGREGEKWKDCTPQKSRDKQRGVSRREETKARRRETASICPAATARRRKRLSAQHPAAVACHLAIPMLLRCSSCTASLSTAAVQCLVCLSHKNRSDCFASLAWSDCSKRFRLSLACGEPISSTATSIDAVRADATGDALATVAGEEQRSRLSPVSGRRETAAVHAQRVQHPAGKGGSRACFDCCASG